jgi:Ca2+/Na+ antiporter
MQVQRTLVQDAAARGIITHQQADELWEFFRAQSQHVPTFKFGHVLYYLGGMIMIGAMSLFMTLGWESIGPWWGFIWAVVYAVIAWALMVKLLGRGLKLPAGIMLAMVVALTPLAVYALQQALGISSFESDHHYRDYHTIVGWDWLIMELATLFVATLLLYRYRLPFAVMPVAVTLWYMSMDLADLIALERYNSPHDWNAEWRMRALVSVVFGALMLVLATWVDIRSRRSQDFGFWMHLFGVAAFWGGLTQMGHGETWGEVVFLLINVVMIFYGAIIGRRVYAIFGGLGVAQVLGWFSYRVFQDSLAFPLVLSFIGLAVVGLGILWQKREREWTAAVRSVLPTAVRETLEARD